MTKPGMSRIPLTPLFRLFDGPLFYHWPGLPVQTFGSNSSLQTSLVLNYDTRMIYFREVVALVDAKIKGVGGFAPIPACNWPAASRGPASFGSPDSRWLCGRCLVNKRVGVYGKANWDIRNSLQCCKQAGLDSGSHP